MCLIYAENNVNVRRLSDIIRTISKTYCTCTHTHTNTYTHYNILKHTDIVFHFFRLMIENEVSQVKRPSHRTHSFTAMRVF